MPDRLDTSPRLARPDDAYELLVGATRGLDDAQARLVQAKLVLLLANHIGDPAVLAEAIALARAGVAGEPGGGDGGAPAGGGVAVNRRRAHQDGSLCERRSRGGRLNPRD